MEVIHFDVGAWRAKGNQQTLKENSLRICEALGLVWGVSDPNKTVYVGRDTRDVSAETAPLAGEVFQSFGLAPRVCISAAPAPAIEWTSATDPWSAGSVLLGAADFPPDYAGLSARAKDGGPLDAGICEEVDRQIVGTEDLPTQGHAPEFDPKEPYLAHLLSMVDCDLIARAHIRVVVDTMHGSASAYVPELLRRAGAEVIEARTNERSDFSGIHPKCQEPWIDECEQVVQETKADLGLVIDGDGARAVAVDNSAQFVSAHVLTPIIMKHLVEHHGLVGRVVCTHSCSTRLENMAEALDLELTRTRVGFTNLASELREGDVLLAAEEYGGIAYGNHIMERDGLLNCLYAVEALAALRDKVTDASFRDVIAAAEELCGHMEYTRKDIRMEVATVQGFRNILPGLNPETICGMTPDLVSHADGLKLGFADGSWLLLRPSRQQPLVRAYAEAKTVEQKDALLEAAVELTSTKLS